MPQRSRNIKEILIKMISNSRLKIDLIQEDSRLRNNDIKNHYGCNKKNDIFIRKL